METKPDQPTESSSSQQPQKKVALPSLKKGMSKKNKTILFAATAFLVVVAVGFGIWKLLGSGTKQKTATLEGTSGTQEVADGVAAVGKHTQNATLKIGFLPKLKDIPYFDSCAKGAQAAAEELGIELTYDGPIEASAEQQEPFIRKWIDENYDVIAVSGNDPDTLTPLMKEALASGIRVITWDADTARDSREFFVNQATYDGVGFALIDKMVEEVGSDASIGIITASLTDKNQNLWIDAIQRRVASKYPNITIVGVLPGQHDEKIAYDNTKKLLSIYPETEGIIAPDSVSFPAAAKAIGDLGKGGQVAVNGLSTPTAMREYVKSGVVKNVILWKTEDLGYLTVYSAKALADGKLKAGDTSIDVGELGEKDIVGSEILLGDPFVFTEDNIDDYNY